METKYSFDGYKGWYVQNMMTIVGLCGMFYLQLEKIGLIKKTRGLDYTKDGNPIFKRPIGLVRGRRP